MIESLTNIPRRQIDLDAEGYGKQAYTSRHQKGFIGRLIVTEGAALGRTHRVKSQEHTWEGTAEEFRDTFDKADAADADKPNQLPAASAMSAAAAGVSSAPAAPAAPKKQTAKQKLAAAQAASAAAKLADAAGDPNANK